MWIRDSAFQIGVLMPKISKRPALRFLVEGGIRLQAFYILQVRLSSNVQLVAKIILKLLLMFQIFASSSGSICQWILSRVEGPV